MLVTTERRAPRSRTVSTSSPTFTVPRRLRQRTPNVVVEAGSMTPNWEGREGDWNDRNVAAAAGGRWEGGNHDEANPRLEDPAPSVAGCDGAGRGLRRCDRARRTGGRR